MYCNKQEIGNLKDSLEFTQNVMRKVKQKQNEQKQAKILSE